MDSPFSFCWPHLHIKYDHCFGTLQDDIYLRTEVWRYLEFLFVHANYRAGRIQCPVCKKAMVTLPENTVREIDREIQETPLPPELRFHVNILCNDCLGRSEVAFHILGHKCGTVGRTTRPRPSDLVLERLLSPVSQRMWSFWPAITACKVVSAVHYTVASPVV